MSYELAFDAAQPTAQLWLPALGLVVIGAGAWLWASTKGALSFWRGMFVSSGPWMGGALTAMAVGLLWTAFTCVAFVLPYFGYRAALRNGETCVVEGRVTEFHPMPASGHDTERFVVEGVRFKYSDYAPSPAFTNTSSHGGPIREGLHVRIHYLGPAEDASILRLEIRR
ncbi:MAG TPA: hypothetical protein VGQ83_32365 [Polyangia bacterium]|jgi:hypothetical protein